MLFPCETTGVPPELLSGVWGGLACTSPAGVQDVDVCLLGVFSKSDELIRAADTSGDPVLS